MTGTLRLLGKYGDNPVGGVDADDILTGIGGLAAANNLSDVGNALTALGNLGGVALSEGNARSLGYKIATDTQWAGGVKADGTTDDTTALQAVCTAGGKIWLPRGTIKVTAQILIYSNTHIRGHGRGTVLVGAFASAQAYLMRNDSSSQRTNISIKGVTFDRGNSTNGQHALGLRNINGLVLDDLAVLGYTTTTGGGIIVGGFVSNTTDPTVYNARISNIYGYQQDNFLLQLGAVIQAVGVNIIGEDCFREVVGIEPGLLNTTPLVAERIALTNIVLTNSQTKTSGSTHTGMLVITGTSGGTVRNVTVDGVSCATTGTVPAGEAIPHVGIYGATRVSVRGVMSYGAPGCAAVVGTTVLGGDGVTNIGACTDVFVQLEAYGGNTGANTDAGVGNPTSDVAVSVRASQRVTVDIKANATGSATAWRLPFEEASGASGNVIRGEAYNFTSTLPRTLYSGTNWRVKMDQSNANDVQVNSVSFLDGRNIGLGSTSGTKLGTASSQLLGFWGATAIARPTVTGDRLGNAAVTALLTALANAGLVTNSTTDSGVPAGTLVGDYLPGDHGYIGWSFAPETLSSTGVILPASGSAIVTTVKVPVGTALNNVVVETTVAGSGLTNAIVAVCQGGTVLATSSDQTTNWQGVGIRTAALSSAATPTGTAGTLTTVQIVLWATGTTMPTFSKSVVAGRAAVNAGLTTPNLRSATGPTGLTNAASLTTLASPTANTNYPVWVAVK